MSFVDVFSRYTWIYFLQSKYEAFSTFQKFKIHVEKLLGQSILCIQIDKGGEFKPFIPFLTQHGNEHRMTCLIHPNKMVLLKGNINISWTLVLLLSPKHLFPSLFRMKPLPLVFISLTDFPRHFLTMLVTWRSSLALNLIILH